MQESEKQFKPAFQENSDVGQTKEVGPERGLVEESLPTAKGGVNAPESIMEEEGGVRKVGELSISKEILAGLKKGERKIAWKLIKGKELPLNIIHGHSGGWIKELRSLRGRYPDDITAILEKKKISAEERDVLEEYAKRIMGWREPLTEAPIEVVNRQLKKQRLDGASGEGAKEKYQILKQARMTELRISLSALDNGEMIEAFNRDGRRTLLYDEDGDSFFVETDQGRKNITLGDVSSDYAYGVDYMPDGNMPHSIFRKVAKSILINEARRDIEAIYNKELATKDIQVATRYPDRELESLWKMGNPAVLGFIAETMSRELLSRKSYDGKLGYKVLRANVLEDARYKIDFKLKTSRLKRGIVVEEENAKDKFKKIGIQFSAGHRLGQLRRKVARAKRTLEKEMPVDDIIIVKISAKHFKLAYEKWLWNSKPSGGPEQFLPKNLKIKLLKETTRGLVKIKDDEIEKIFGDKEESSFAKASEDKEKLAA